MSAQEIKPWELQDPARTLSEITKRGRARAGTTLIAYVANEWPGGQEVREIRMLTTPVPYRGDDGEAEYLAMRALQNQLHDVAREIVRERTFDGTGWSHMTGILVTVVCREGRVISTDEEWQFVPAWRYSNHLTTAFDGDIFVVTPHGWTSIRSDRSGHEPKLTSGPVLTVV